MDNHQDKNILEFRLNRIRNAPRNWAYWVAFFTALNGLFVLIDQDIVIGAGLIFPFIIPTPTLHFISAGILALISYLSSRVRSILWVSLIVYVLDTIFSAYFQFWFASIMHIVVIFLVGIALISGRQLKKQLDIQLSSNNS